MKKLILSALMALTVCPLQAQLFGPESLTGAALGGIAGGIIGHNNGRKTAEGAAIGAGAGLVLGALVGHDRREREREAYYGPAPVYASAPRSYVSVQASYGHGHYYQHRPYHHPYRHHYGHYGPRAVFYSRPMYWGAPVVVAPAPTVVVAPAPAPAPVNNTTIINNNYYNTPPATPMSGANSMFGR